VARAKRTDRAEARRRYRQNQLEQEAETNGLAVDGSGAAAARASAAKPAPARPPQPRASTARPGFLGAFRLAAAPADVRADIRALPSLLRTRAAIIPGILILATFVATFAFGARQDFIVALAFQAFLAPPPMAAAFLAGILAERGAWLLGLLTGLVAAVAFAIIMLVAPDDVILGLFRANTAIPAGFRESYALQALALSPLMGLATGAFAGFYRRFLRMASPNPSGSRSRSSSKQRNAASRR
jgi:hypothetical protein